VTFRTAVRPGAAPARRDLGPLPSQADIVIIGSGFAGIAAAVALSAAGRSYVMVERDADVAGTWRDNSYPGCACDVPSHLYSYSFAPNPGWTRAFSPQPEIYAYLQRVAAKYGIYDHCWFDTELQESRWDSASQTWQMQTSQGPITAPVVIEAAGPLSEPSIPDLPGIDTFAGPTFHSAQWRHDLDLSGHRVACIGTGASAVQFVPEIAPATKQLTVFQRTAPWVIRRRDRGITRFERWVYRRWPVTQRLARTLIYWGRETWSLGFGTVPSAMKAAEAYSRSLIRHQVADPELRKKLIPEFTFGCKRVLLSKTWYPALSRPNVDLVTDRIVEVTPTGIVTADDNGVRTEHDVDTIIFGTGFRATDPPIAHRLIGADGLSLAEHWRTSGAQALRGTTVAGFPNLFIMIGPNTGLGHTSMVYVIESQIAYILQLLTAKKTSGSSVVAARPDAERRYNDRVQRRLKRTVWSVGGCSSYYIDENGHNGSLWPTFSFRFRQAVRKADLSEYELTGSSPRSGGSAGTE
jgi:cation diffusion facilitator CzcD-associated flavoprotein CzcO